MICDHCGADTAKMEGTVKRCWCGLWIETQPEFDDTDALKKYCQALPSSDYFGKEYKPNPRKRKTLEEKRAKATEYERKRYALNREKILQRKKEYYHAKKRAA